MLGHVNERSGHSIIRCDWKGRPKGTSSLGRSRMRRDDQTRSNLRKRVGAGRKLGRLSHERKIKRRIVGEVTDQLGFE